MGLSPVRKANVDITKTEQEHMLRGEKARNSSRIPQAAWFCREREPAGNRLRLPVLPPGPGDLVGKVQFGGFAEIAHLLLPFF